ncbi:MAG: hypothetical protein ACKPKO_52585 [Candidatus Fonsibacter sp.]
MFTTSFATTPLVLTDSTTANTIICNTFERTIVITNVVIKTINVIFGDTITHTLLAGAASHFYAEANCYQSLRAKNGFCIRIRQRSWTFHFDIHSE